VEFIRLTVFFCLSAGSINKDDLFVQNSLFKIGEVEPSFKEFLASPAVRFLVLGGKVVSLMPIKPDFGLYESVPGLLF
jgi:hypothetical protein